MRRLLTIASVAALAAIAAPAAYGGVANGGLPGATSNPLTGITWGQYRIASTDPNGKDPVSAYYNTAQSDADRSTFDKLLSVPRFRWFGAWNANPRDAASSYVQEVTHGNQDIGVQIAIFRLVPFEHAACGRLPTSSEVSAYKDWIAQYANGIGSARVALVLQPDMPFTLCLPQHSPIDLQLISWTVKQFSALPHTTVYIDAGAGDWMKPGTMASMLKRAGVAQARGFAVDLTHFDSTPHEVAYGKKIVAALAGRGVRGSHFVVDTSKNGRPFTTQAHMHEFLRGTVCASRSSTACVTLGQPPTTNTGNPAVDGYLWIGRPWVNNATRRSYDEVLQLVRTSPFFG